MPSSFRVGSGSITFLTDFAITSEPGEPDRLREKFLSFYRDAYKMYSGELTDI